MWPGDQQSGGQQNPQGSPTPPQQPPGVPGGYGQPNPYAQPAPSAGPTPPPPPPPPAYAAPTQPYGTPTPSPYAQPGYQQQPSGYSTPQPWGPPAPGGPQGPPPGKQRNTTTIAIAVTAAVAVIAAVVVGAVYFTGDKKKDDAKGDPTTTAAAPKSPTPTPTPTPTDTATDDPSASGGSGDSPRGAPVDYKPVIPGWKVVRRDQRNVLFDVPSDWTVDSQGMTIGFADKSGNPAVAMSGPAYFKHNFCRSGNSTYDRAAVGTKGANGASSVRNAAEVQAKSWAYWAYQVDGKGTFSKVLDSKAFHNSHGITGWSARATASNIPTPTRCSSNAGEAWTVAWLDPSQSDPTKKLVVWVLYADRGVPDALAQSVVDKIKSTIRFEKQQ